MVVDPLPTPPSTSDSANFNSRADAFLAALVNFGTQVNAALVALAAGNLPAGSISTFVAGILNSASASAFRTAIDAPGKSADFAANLAAKGSQHLPGGLILQWGMVNTLTSGDVAVTFDTPFASACYSVTGLPIVTGGGPTAAQLAAAPTTTGFSISCYNSGARVAQNVYWQAIGK